MSYFPTSYIVPKNSPATDAFHRLRVSDVIRQFSSMAEYNDNPLIWENATVGTGNLDHIDHQCSVQLSTGGTANGASAIRQTKRYMRYMPGKSLNIAQTFVMSAPATNAVAEIGYYDGYNGIFLQRSGSIINLIIRSNTTDTPIDTIVPQSEWNLDKLDGYGPSGKTLDLTKAQILLIDVQFLGVGRVRVGFDFGNPGVVYCHEFLHANLNTTAYMSTACLPLRSRVYNIGVASGIVSLFHICCAVTNEGGTGPGSDSEGIFQFSASTSNTLITAGTSLTPILSIRAATKFGGSVSGVTPNRGQIIPNIIDTYTSADAVYEIWLNGTLTGANWVENASYSLTEYDVSSTVFDPTNAIKICSGYISSVSKSNTISFDNFINFPLVYSGLNGIQDTLTICIKTLTGFGNVGASIDWIERY